MLRIRAALLDYFPAALVAYQLGTLTLTSPDVLTLLAKAPTPAAAAELTTAQITAALRMAGRRGDVAGRAAAVRAALRTEQLGQSDIVAGAYAATVRSGVAILQTQQISVSCSLGTYAGWMNDAQSNRHSWAADQGTQGRGSRSRGPRVSRRRSRGRICRASSRRPRRCCAVAAPATRAWVRAALSFPACTSVLRLGPWRLWSRRVRRWFRVRPIR